MELRPEWEGEVRAKWDGLRQKYGGSWEFSVEPRGEEGNIAFRAARKIPTDDDTRMEIVHPVDIPNVPKVCAKIAFLERKIMPYPFFD